MVRRIVLVSSLVLGIAMLAASGEWPSNQEGSSKTVEPGGARICTWAGWLPPETGRERVRAAHVLTGEEETSLRRALLSADVHARDGAARKLSAGRDPATVTALLQAAGDPNATVREGVLRSLGRTGSRRALPALEAAARDSSKVIRQAAVWSLGQLQDTGSVGALLSATHDESEHVRTEAAWALGMTMDTAVLVKLDSLTRDATKATRVAAVCAMGWLGGAVDVRLLSDSSEAVRAAARWARAPSSLRLPARMSAIRAPSGR